MKRRVIISIYDDGLRIGEAISLIDKVGYDSTCFEKDCIWRFSDGHYVRQISLRINEVLSSTSGKEKLCVV